MGEKGKHQQKNSPPADQIPEIDLDSLAREVGTDLATGKKREEVEVPKTAEEPIEAQAKVEEPPKTVVQEKPTGVDRQKQFEDLRKEFDSISKEADDKLKALEQVIPGSISEAELNLNSDWRRLRAIGNRMDAILVEAANDLGLDVRDKKEVVDKLFVKVKELEKKLAGDHLEENVDKMFDSLFSKSKDKESRDLSVKISETSRKINERIFAAEDKLKYVLKNPTELPFQRNDFLPKEEEELLRNSLYELESLIQGLEISGASRKDVADFLAGKGVLERRLEALLVAIKKGGPVEKGAAQVKGKEEPEMEVNLEGLSRQIDKAFEKAGGEISYLENSLELIKEGSVKIDIDSLRDFILAESGLGGLIMNFHKEKGNEKLLDDYIKRQLDLEERLLSLIRKLKEAGNGEIKKFEIKKQYNEEEVKSLLTEGEGEFSALQLALEQVKTEDQVREITKKLMALFDKVVASELSKEERVEAFSTRVHESIIKAISRFGEFKNKEKVEDLAKEFQEVAKLEKSPAGIKSFLAESENNFTDLQLVLEQAKTEEQVLEVTNKLEALFDKVLDSGLSKEPRVDAFRTRVHKSIIKSINKSRELKGEKVVDFSGISNFEELYKLLDKVGGVTYSDGHLETAENLKVIIGLVRNGIERPDAITRVGGLRKKVWELMEKERLDQKEDSILEKDKEQPVKDIETIKKELDEALTEMAGSLNEIETLARNNRLGDGNWLSVAQNILAKAENLSLEHFEVFRGLEEANKLTTEQKQAYKQKFLEIRRRIGKLEEDYPILRTATEAEPIKDKQPEISGDNGDKEKLPKKEKIKSPATAKIDLEQMERGLGYLDIDSARIMESLGEGDIEELQRLMSERQNWEASSVYYSNALSLPEKELRTVFKNRKKNGNLPNGFPEKFEDYVSYLQEGLASAKKYQQEAEAGLSAFYQEKLRLILAEEGKLEAFKEEEINKIAEDINNVIKQTIELEATRVMAEFNFKKASGLGKEVLKNLAVSLPVGLGIGIGGTLPVVIKVLGKVGAPLAVIAGVTTTRLLVRNMFINLEKKKQSANKAQREEALVEQKIEVLDNFFTKTDNLRTQLSVMVSNVLRQETSVESIKAIKAYEQAVETDQSPEIINSTLQEVEKDFYKYALSLVAVEYPEKDYPDITPEQRQNMAVKIALTLAEHEKGDNLIAKKVQGIKESKPEVFKTIQRYNMLSMGVPKELPADATREEKDHWPEDRAFILALLTGVATGLAIRYIGPLRIFFGAMAGAGFGYSVGEEIIKNKDKKIFSEIGKMIDEAEGVIEDLEFPAEELPQLRENSSLVRSRLEMGLLDGNPLLKNRAENFIHQVQKAEMKNSQVLADLLNQRHEAGDKLDAQINKDVKRLEKRTKFIRIISMGSGALVGATAAFFGPMVFRGLTQHLFGHNDQPSAPVAGHEQVDSLGVHKPDSIQTGHMATADTTTVEQRPDSVQTEYPGSTDVSAVEQRLHSLGLIHPESSHVAPEVAVGPIATAEAGVAETAVAHTATAHFKDVIDSSELKGGHDSMWHSTKTIFEKNAQALGYKGEMNDHVALDKWSENQTANAMHDFAIKHDGHIPDLVQNNDTVNIDVVDGKNVLSFENTSGIELGYLPDTNIDKTLADTTIETTPESQAYEQAFKSAQQELDKVAVLGEKLDDFMSNDKSHYDHDIYSAAKSSQSLDQVFQKVMTSGDSHSLGSLVHDYCHDHNLSPDLEKTFGRELAKHLNDSHISGYKGGLDSLLASFRENVPDNYKELEHLFKEMGHNKELVPAKIDGQYVLVDRGFIMEHGFRKPVFSIFNPDDLDHAVRNIKGSDHMKDIFSGKEHFKVEEPVVYPSRGGVAPETELYKDQSVGTHQEVSQPEAKVEHQTAQTAHQQAVPEAKIEQSTPQVAQQEVVPEVNNLDASATAGVEKMGQFETGAGQKVTFSYGPKGEVTSFVPEGKFSDPTGNYGDFLKDDFVKKIVANWEASGKKGDWGLIEQKIKSMAGDLGDTNEILKNMETAHKGDTPEAEFLRSQIQKTIQEAEKDYGDVFKDFATHVETGDHLKLAVESINRGDPRLNFNLEKIATADPDYLQRVKDDVRASLFALEKIKGDQPGAGQLASGYKEVIQAIDKRLKG
jgi:hypothetical protein